MVIPGVPLCVTDAGVPKNQEFASAVPFAPRATGAHDHTTLAEDPKALQLNGHLRLHTFPAAICLKHDPSEDPEGFPYEPQRETESGDSTQQRPRCQPHSRK